MHKFSILLHVFVAFAAGFVSGRNLLMEGNGAFSIGSKAELSCLLPENRGSVADCFFVSPGGDVISGSTSETDHHEFIMLETGCGLTVKAVKSRDYGKCFYSL